MKSKSNISDMNNSMTSHPMYTNESSIIADDNQTLQHPLEDCTGLEVALQVNWLPNIFILKSFFYYTKARTVTYLLVLYFQGILNAKAVPSSAFYILFTLYVLVIVGSFIGNVLVITAVIRSPSLRKVSYPKTLM